MFWYVWAVVVQPKPISRTCWCSWHNSKWIWWAVASVCCSATATSTLEANNLLVLCMTATLLWLAIHAQYMSTFYWHVCSFHDQSWRRQCWTQKRPWWGFQWVGQSNRWGYEEQALQQTSVHYQINFDVVGWLITLQLGNNRNNLPKKADHEYYREDTRNYGNPYQEQFCPQEGQDWARVSDAEIPCSNVFWPNVICKAQHKSILVYWAVLLLSEPACWSNSPRLVTSRHAGDDAGWWD